MNGLGDLSSHFSPSVFWFGMGSSQASQTLSVTVFPPSPAPFCHKTGCRVHHNGTDKYAPTGRPETRVLAHDETMQIFLKRTRACMDSFPGKPFDNWGADRYFENKLIPLQCVKTAREREREREDDACRAFIVREPDHSEMDHLRLKFNPTRIRIERLLDMSMYIES